MPRFVILEHDQPHLHWDLMLEMGDVLWTWRLSAPPAPPATGAATVAAERIGNHRLAYLDYEGPVSGGRGRVRRWDAGVYEAEFVEPERLRICCQGGRLSGAAELRRAAGDRWELVFV